MDSPVWPIAHTVSLLVQTVFLANIGFNLVCLCKTKKLGRHLHSGAGIVYAIFLVAFFAYIFLLWSEPKFDQVTQLASFRIFGVGSALLGVVLASYSNSAKKRLLAS